ncbi:MAG: type II toxin-antitoxin system Phd/YefM family antitoxin [Chloroflexi bacterium]|nr:type II toxin-antitoxin system Phd/YefM family antitoxin [Chloroflexota bacterium]
MTVAFLAANIANKLANVIAKIVGEIMPKAVSSTEVQNKFATLMQWANDNHDSVVIEVRGKPKAAIISYADYEELLRLRKLEQKRKALAALDALRKEIRRQNPELTNAEGDHQSVSALTEEQA